MSISGTIIFEENGTTVKFNIPHDKLFAAINLIPKENIREAISYIKTQQHEDVVTEKKKKKRKTKRPKNPNAPKKPTSAYVMWLVANRSQIKELLGENHKPTDVMVEAGKQWKELDVSVKKYYQEAFKVDQDRYKSEIALFKQGLYFKRNPEPEPEPEDEEVLKVDEVVINGETYYKDENDTIYDPETSEVIGKLVGGKIVRE